MKSLQLRKYYSLQTLVILKLYHLQNFCSGIGNITAFFQLHFFVDFLQFVFRKNPCTQENTKLFLHNLMFTWKSACTFQHNFSIISMHLSIRGQTFVWYPYRNLWLCAIATALHSYHRGGSASCCTYLNLRMYNSCSD